MSYSPIAIGAALAVFEKYFSEIEQNQIPAEFDELNKEASEVLAWLVDGYHKISRGEISESDLKLQHHNFAERVRYEMVLKFLKNREQPNLQNVSETLLYEINRNYHFFEFFCEVMRGYFSQREL
jgi:ubiquitin C-terminal hydrolase